MKKMKIVQVFTLLFLAIGFVACDTEPVDPVLLDNIGNPGTSQGTFKVDFSGQTYEATAITAVINDGMLAISGYRGSGGNTEQIAFLVPNPEVGSFSGDDLLMYYQPAGEEYQYINFNLEQVSGSVNITSIDTANHTVSGTFSFTGWWSNDEEEVAPIEFTNGSFTNVTYQGTMPGGGETGDDILTAVLDGTNFPVANVAVAVADGGSGETISINGLDANQNKVIVSMKASLNPGTYNITGNILEDVVGGRYTTTSPEAMYMATTGSVTINSKTETRIAGTFAFTATGSEGTVTVTEGTFDVDYSF